MERVDVEALYGIPDCVREYASATPVRGSTALQDSCSISLGEVAQWLRLDPRGDPAIDDVRFPVRSIRPGATLCRQGEPFHWVHALVGGRFKNVVVDRRGSEQIVSLGFAGEIVGFDGAAGTCPATTVALTQGLVARLPHAQLVELGAHHPLARQLIDHGSAAEIARHMNTVRLLAIAKASSRLAAFLLALGHCAHGDGTRAETIDLAMTRSELGNYLGLRFETVIRGFAALARDGLVRLRRRDVDLLDPEGLEAVAAGARPRAHRRATMHIPRDADRVALQGSSPSAGQHASERASDRRPAYHRGDARHASGSARDRRSGTGSVR